MPHLSIGVVNVNQLDPLRIRFSNLLLRQIDNNTVEWLCLCPTPVAHPSIADLGGLMRRVSRLLLLLALLWQLGPDFQAYAQDRVRIGVPLFPTVSYPVFIAQERGFFEKNGLKGEIIRINSEPTTYQALISGDIDATSGAPTGLVQSNIQGVPVVSLGSWDNFVSYTMIAREKIDDLSQLKGKKIGINRLGGKSSLVLRVMLEDAGLNTSKDVTLLQLGGSQERLAASTRRRWTLHSNQR